MIQLNSEKAKIKIIKLIRCKQSLNVQEHYLKRKIGFSSTKLWRSVSDFKFKKCPGDISPFKGLSQRKPLEELSP